MDQCDCMFQMIEETFQPWVIPREIDVLWDVMVDVQTRVYADIALIRRLVVNLATNAIRATRQ